MPTPRLHLPVALAAGETVTLDDNARRHAVQVLRLREGDRIVLFNGRGGECEAQIVACSRREVTARLLRCTATERESPLAVHLGLGIARGERMDFALQKATELGVAAVTPLFTERVVVRLDDKRAAKRLAHWQGVIVAACEQCGRNRLPVLHAPQPLATWLAGRDETRRLFLDPQATQALGGLPAPAGPLALAIGPEGGFTGDERRAIAAADFTGVRLGPRILRTETAVLAALAAVQVLWGDLGGG